MTQTRKLRVCIVGSGLAGLATARILREHHDVTVFERGNPDVATGGQGIVFFPSAVKILKSMGYDPDRACPVKVARFCHFDRLGNNNEMTELNWEVLYGTDPWSGLRSDCRDELFRLASGPAQEVGLNPDCAPAQMFFNNAVIDIDSDKGVVTLNNGNKHQFDLVIVADGIHSRLRGRLQGGCSNVPQKTGLTIYRVAVQRSEGKGSITYFQSLDSTNRLIVTYNLRHFEYIHVSLHLPTADLSYGDEIQSWIADANREEILESFNGFNETLLKLVKVGTQLKVWDMQDLDPLPFWNNGRVVLIGDAAHAMTPMQGLGANMAIEDAEAFRLLVPGTRPDEIPAILHRIDSVRRPRTATILHSTRQTLPNTPMEERMERFKFNNDYNGIVDALERQEGVVGSAG